MLNLIKMLKPLLNMIVHSDDMIVRSKYDCTFRYNCADCEVL